MPKTGLILALFVKGDPYRGCKVWLYGKYDERKGHVRGSNTGRMRLTGRKGIDRKGARVLRMGFLCQASVSFNLYIVPLQRGHGSKAGEGFPAEQSPLFVALHTQTSVPCVPQRTGLELLIHVTQLRRHFLLCWADGCEADRSPALESRIQDGLTDQGPWEYEPGW
jgi:hypothetical protein